MKLPPQESRSSLLFILSKLSSTSIKLFQPINSPSRTSDIKIVFSDRHRRLRRSSLSSSLIIIVSSPSSPDRRTLSMANKERSRRR
ncbi:hypothetical protein V2J09_000993 [Rumex salicifolius]